jgi:hypothetical protein
MISESISKKFGNPTKEEVDDFMKKNPKQVYDPERVKIRVIVLNEGNPLWDDAKLDPFVKDLKEHPETFQEKAQKYSDGKSAPSGGSQGFIFKGTFDKQIYNRTIMKTKYFNGNIIYIRKYLIFLPPCDLLLLSNWCICRLNSVSFF